MMRCEQVQELITARLDNELNAAQQSTLDAHLKVASIAGGPWRRKPA